MKTFKIATILLSIFSAQAFATLTNVDENEAKAVSSRLFEHIASPGADASDKDAYFNVIGKTNEANGFYAIEKDGSYFFATKNGRYIVGDLVDLETDQSLLAQATKIHTKPLLNQLGAESYIRFPSTLEATTGLLYVFSDPTCSFCQTLHGQFEQLNATGIEIRVIPYVRSLDDRKQEPVTKNYQAIMGIEDMETRRIAYHGYMGNGDDITEFKITDAGSDRVFDGYALGKKLGLTGTPFLMNSDGDRFSGQLTNERIMDTLFNQEK